LGKKPHTRDRYGRLAQWQLYCQTHNIEKMATQAMRAGWGGHPTAYARIDAPSRSRMDL